MQVKVSPAFRRARHDHIARFLKCPDAIVNSPHTSPPHSSVPCVNLTDCRVNHRMVA